MTYLCHVCGEVHRAGTPRCGPVPMRPSLPRAVPRVVTWYPTSSLAPSTLISSQEKTDMTLSGLKLAQLALANQSYPGQDTKKPTAWSSVDIVYAAGWAAGPIPVQYRIDSEGTVSLRGLTRRAVAGAGLPMFTLPLGFRPPGQLVIPTSGNDPGPGPGPLTASVQFEAVGDVSLLLPTATSGANADIRVDGVTFSIFV